MVGTSFSHYKILDLLGAGGMGEVYRAEDTKLGREVALKVLPGAFTADPERLARFEREARALAAVDHPHIAALYSFESATIEEDEGEAGPGSAADPKTVYFLVMQLADGETLGQYLGGGAIPVEEARLLALQIAGAVELAHEKGIIHRDLKPANIKVDADGQVKILDFGLAKALDLTVTGTEVDETLAESGGVSPAQFAEAPTISAEMTEEGMILGTAGYMSPEQARGLPADKRSDIWAFGCVFFEMLTGRRVFGGDTASDRLARVLERDPEWERLPEETPRSIRTLLHRCLAKNPKRRLQDMGDVRLELEEVPEIEALTVPAPEPAPLWRRVLPWAAAVIGVGLGIWALMQPEEEPAPRQVTRFTVPTPPLAVRGLMVTPQVAISPDGSRVAYIVGESEFGQLHVRDLDSAEATALEGADNVYAPFFSPDGAWVGFQEGQEIKRVSIEGGKIWTVAETEYAVGATWGPDGTIVYGAEMSFGLWRVPWDGGEPQRLTTVDRDSGEYLHMNPQFLPDGRTVLFSVFTPGHGVSRMVLLDLDSGRTSDLPFTQGLAQYLTSGHLAYGYDGSLMVVPFDPRRRELIGRPVAVMDGFATSATNRGLAHFAVADNGTLVYISGPVVSNQVRLVRVGRDGQAEPFGPTENRLFGPRFSPDGSRLALWAQVDNDLEHVWTLDLDRNTFTRLTFEGENWWPLWSPDGRHVTFPTRDSPASVVNLSRIEADGSGSTERLTRGELNEQPNSWTPDGRTLIYHRNDHPETGWDVMAVGLEENSEPRVLLGTRFNELLAALSPDGRWLAYVSDESGHTEVYVRSYPDLERKWQISSGDGIEPAWSADGRELFYRNTTGNRMMVVAISTDPDFSPGREELLFEGSYVRTTWFGRNFDVAPDSQSFVMVEDVLPEDFNADLQVVVNWFDELEQQTASGEP